MFNEQRKQERRNWEEYKAKKEKAKKEWNFPFYFAFKRIGLIK